MPEADAAAVEAAAALARRVQPLWAAVPVGTRAAVLRRAAQAVLDELDTLAVLLAGETGRPRTDALLAELLPAVSGLHALADAAPGALADRRLARRAARAAGRRDALVAAPVGVCGLRGGAGSPWAEPLLEAAAALVAGNAVLLVPAVRLAGDRLASVFARAGAPEELVRVVHGAAAAAALDEVCDVVSTADAPPGKGAMVVLGGAPVPEVVDAALWAGFAGGGRHPGAVGHVIVVEELAGAATAGLVEAAGRLRVGDPLDPATEVGPLASAESLGEIDAAVAAEGTERLCGGPVDVPGLAGPFLAPTVLRATRPTASPDSSGAPPAHVAPAPPGPVVTVVAARDDAEAAALADGTGAPAVSVWAGSPATGERVARELRAELTWVGEHGHAIAAAAPVRLARHVRVRRLASQRGGLRSVRWLPYDPALVRARVAAARLAHGRDSERWDALRSGAVPIARTLAGRLTRRTGPGRTGRGP